MAEGVSRSQKYAGAFRYFVLKSGDLGFGSGQMQQPLRASLLWRINGRSSLTVLVITYDLSHC
jgi:hypothetical protein